MVVVGAGLRKHYVLPQAQGIDGAACATQHWAVAAEQINLWSEMQSYQRVSYEHLDTVDQA